MVLVKRKISRILVVGPLGLQVSEYQPDANGEPPAAGRTLLSVGGRGLAAATELRRRGQWSELAGALNEATFAGRFILRSLRQQGFYPNYLIHEAELPDPVLNEGAFPLRDSRRLPELMNPLLADFDWLLCDGELGEAALRRAAAVAQELGGAGGRHGRWQERAAAAGADPRLAGAVLRLLGGPGAAGPQAARRRRLHCPQSGPGRAALARAYGRRRVVDFGGGRNGGLRRLARLGYGERRAGRGIAGLVIGRQHFQQRAVDRRVRVHGVVDREFRSAPE